MSGPIHGGLPVVGPRPLPLEQRVLARLRAVSLSNEPVEVSRSALSLADLAYMETPGPAMTKVGAAISAYLWACREAKPWGHNPEMTVYPSLNDLRAFLALERERELTEDPS